MFLLKEGSNRFTSRLFLGLATRGERVLQFVVVTQQASKLLIAHGALVDCFIRFPNGYKFDEQSLHVTRYQPSLEYARGLFRQ